MTFWDALFSVPLTIWGFISTPLCVVIVLIILSVTLLFAVGISWSNYLQLTDWSDGGYDRGIHIFWPIMWTALLIIDVWVFVALGVYFGEWGIQPLSWEPTNI